jgi:predicted unusual protein kinase regulating ubiquinone biosynthesis (AarF/ABC1/UbiB family)
LEGGGVTVVKLGQVLSTHPDLLPIEFVDELTKPQDTVPPAPREQVHEVLTAELGAAPRPSSPSSTRSRSQPRPSPGYTAPGCTRTPRSW